MAVNSSFAWSDFPPLFEAAIASGASAPQPVAVESRPDFSDSSSRKISSNSPISYQDLVTCCSTSQAECRPASDKPHRKAVSFSKVLQIREHSLTVGDHPDCSLLPISLDWTHEDVAVCLDDFEAVRVPSRRPAGRLLRLSYSERKNMLSRFLTHDELERAIFEPRCGYKIRHVPAVPSLAVHQVE
jgi:hypothetical protein